MDSMTNQRHALIIGAGISGMLMALALRRREMRVTLIDPHFDGESDSQLPYICSKIVIDFLQSELPETNKALWQRGARRISIADILRSRFPTFQSDVRDQSTAFLCASRSLLRRVLLEQIELTETEVIKDRVCGLIRKDNRVVGVRLSQGRVFGDLTVDTGGTRTERSQWIEELGLRTEKTTPYGPRLVSLTKFYRYRGEKSLQFNLASGRNFRGGVYPLEENGFSLALIVGESLVKSATQAQVFFDQSIEEIPGAIDLLMHSDSTHNLQVLRGIQSRCSDFYLDSLMLNSLQGFYPIGDSVLSGNPIYGQGISLAILQIKCLLSALPQKTSQAIDYGQIEEKMAGDFVQTRKHWSDGALADQADEETRGIHRRFVSLFRNIYVALIIPEMALSPTLSRNFLYNYQLMLPAWRIAQPHHYLKGLVHLFKRLCLKTRELDINENR